MDDEFMEQVLRNQLASMDALYALMGGHGGNDLRAAMDATLKTLERLRAQQRLAHK